MKTFYAHLVQIEIIEKELNSLDLSENEKNNLMHHVHSSIHYKVLDVILSELPEEQKKEFLEHMQNNRHSKVWELLLKHTQGIEEKIKNVSNLLLLEFAKDVSMIYEKHNK